MQAERKRILPLLAVVAIALAVRAYAAHASPCVSKDALWFVTGAQAIEDGQMSAWLGQDQHPLYAACVWLFGQLCGDWIRGGLVFNVLMGALAITPAYLLARALFGRRAALCAAFFLAIHSYAVRYSADVLSEPTYLFLFLCAVLFGLSGLQREDVRLLALCGAASALAYLTRPEGLGVVLVTACWAGVDRASQWRSNAWPKLGRLAILLGAFALVAAPYMIEIGGLTRKKHVGEVLRFQRTQAPQADTSVPGFSQTELIVNGPAAAVAKQRTGISYYVVCAYKLLGRLVSACRHVFIPFVLLGLLCRGEPSRNRRGELYIGSLVLAYLLLLYGLKTSSQYVARRHTFPIAVLLLLWSGPGVLVAARWLARWRPLRPRSRAVLPWLLALMAVVQGVRIAKPEHRDKVGEAEAGLWIRAHTRGRPRVITLELSRVACYAYSPNLELHKAFSERAANGPPVKNPKRVSYWGILDYACRIRATHVVVDEDRIRRLVPGFMADVERACAASKLPRLILCRRFKRSPRDASPSILIYRVVTRPEKQ